MRTEITFKNVAILLDADPSAVDRELESAVAVEETLSHLGYSVTRMLATPEHLTQDSLRGIDVAFIQCYETARRGGAIQGALEFWGVPYTGPGTLSASLTANRYTCRHLWRQFGFPTPEFAGLTMGQATDEQYRIIKRIGYPLSVTTITKNRLVSSLTINNKEELQGQLPSAFQNSEKLLVEHVYTGQLVVGCVLQVGLTLKALPVVELGANGVWNKANIPSKLYEKAQELSIHTHELFGAHGFSRTLMIADPFGKLWMHDIDLLPLFSRNSDIVTAAKHQSISYDELVTHILLSSIQPPSGVQIS